MVPLSATAQRIASLECGPCALRCAMQRSRNTSWTPPLVDFAVDIVTGAITLADATEVLVPASLVHHIEGHRSERQRGAWPWPAWDAAVDDQRVVTCIDAQDVGRLLSSSYGSRYTNLCVPVPANPFVSRLDFGLSIDTFYAATLPGLLDVVHGKARWRAWMRGALTCAYEGTHVPPIRTADYTSQLLRQEGGCETVIWEAAVAGLARRWLETSMKTALAVGIAPSSISLALPEESSSTARLLAMSVEVGVAAWATSAVTDTPLFPRAAALCTPQTLRVFTTGWNALADTPPPTTSADEQESAAVRAVEESLARTADFVDVVKEKCELLVPPTN